MTPIAKERNRLKKEKNIYIMKYFTADTHFNHKSIIEACSRPFKNVWAMNTHIINMWNKVVKDGDLVYHLGDFAFPNRGDGMDVDKIVKRLKGQIYLIKGNHDDKNIRLFDGLFLKIVDIAYLRLDTGERVMLCHYPMLEWRRSCHGSLHLYGHSHGGAPKRKNCLDVGVDAWDFIPITEAEIPYLCEE